MRYPRGSGPGVALPSYLEALPYGKGEIRRTGQRVAVLVFGTLLTPALKAAEALDATVANMRWVKPLDVALLTQLASTHDCLVTVEEGCVMGGAGSAVLEALQASGHANPMLQLGLPDVFVDHGDPAKLLSNIGLDAAGMQASIQRWMAGLK